MPNLVGIGNSQVPTNAMLGGLAYQDSVGEIDIEKIKAQTGDTATDIFVYDTRKDSDGGAWRHRTQNTSWYNEGASATRGARKEFPDVAVIVAEEESVSIYDGDDQNLPLWMKFNAGSGGDNIFNRPTAWDISAVFALNGIICITNGANSAESTLVINYVNDSARLYPIDGYTAYGGDYTLGIAGRSSSLGDYITIDQVIVGDKANDVAMSVLSNAPIDTTTELPVPTIAITTSHGISVIRDDGLVFDFEATANNSANYSSPSVAITRDRKLLYNMQNAAANNYSIILVIPLSLFNQQRSFSYEYAFRNEGYYSYNVTGASSLDISNSYTSYFYDAVETKLGYFSIATNFGLVNIQHFPQTLNDGGRSSLNDGRFNGGMACEITKDYNTGWKVGDIRGVYLADIDDTNIVTGSDLITNGGFSSGTTGWTEHSNWGTLSVVNGRGRIQNANNQNGFIYQQLSVTAGETYIARAQLFKGTNSQVSMQVNSVGGSQSDSTGGVTTDGQYMLQFTPDSNTIQINMGQGTTGNSEYTEVDNVSVRRGEFDRSRSREYQWRNFGLQVYGTIIKEPVANGAELVAYSGFSASNYFYQPYNSELDFGTGDFHIMFWVYFTQNNAYDCLAARRAYSGGSYSGEGWYIEMGSNNNITLKDSDGGAGKGSISGDGTYGVWQHICFVRRNKVGYAYKNGIDQGTQYTYAENLNNSSAALYIGRNADSGGGDADKSKLALFRIGATAPSPEQLKQIYHEEKLLFQENAKCTLFGTSDNVKAIAHDDTNDVTHVGTSSGRSEFQGLNRINNTTTAVTTAISVSNNFVAEQ